MHAIYLERAYDQPQHSDAYRVLVDRLWPRGIKKDNLPLDEWLKSLAPSTELRKWFGHQVDKWPEFEARYQAELATHQDEVTHLWQLASQQPLSLVFAAKDRQHNNAVVIKAYLEAFNPHSSKLE